MQSDSDLLLPDGMVPAPPMGEVERVKLAVERARIIARHFSTLADDMTNALKGLGLVDENRMSYDIWLGRTVPRDVVSRGIDEAQRWCAEHPAPSEDELFDDYRRKTAADKEQAALVDATSHAVAQVTTCWELQGPKIRFPKRCRLRLLAVIDDAVRSLGSAHSEHDALRAAAAAAMRQFVGEYPTGSISNPGMITRPRAA